MQIKLKQNFLLKKQHQSCFRKRRHDHHTTELSKPPQVKPLHFASFRVFVFIFLNFLVIVVDIVDYISYLALNSRYFVLSLTHKWIFRDDVVNTLFLFLKKNRLAAQWIGLKDSCDEFAKLAESICISS